VKRYIALYIFQLVAVACFSQSKAYYSFALNGAQWSETTWWETFCNGNYATCSKDFEYRVEGDTMMDGMQYSKLHVSGGTDWLACKQGNTCAIEKYDSVAGYLREDSRKVYYSNPRKHISDTLLYDFNLKKGDTLPDTYLNKRSMGYRVSKVDSILVGKEYHKVYEIVDDSAKVATKLIDGVGSTTGLLEPIKFSFEAGCSLNEYTHDNVNTQLGLHNETMDDYSTQLKVFADNSFEMFTITFKLPAGIHEALLRLHNIRGELMNIKPISANESPVTDNVSDLSNGIYYYTLSANNKLLASYKFVVVK